MKRLIFAVALVLSAICVFTVSCRNDGNGYVETFNYTGNTSDAYLTITLIGETYTFTGKNTSDIISTATSEDDLFYEPGTVVTWLFDNHQLVFTPDDETILCTLPLEHKKDSNSSSKYAEAIDSWKATYSSDYTTITVTMWNKSLNFVKAE